MGLRYTHEKKELDSAYNNPSGSVGLARIVQPAARVGGRWRRDQRLRQPAARAPGAAAGVGAGGRARRDRLHVPALANRPNGRNVSQSRTEKEWSGTFRLAYDWTDEVMTYVSVARGYKGGGFNSDA